MMGDCYSPTQTIFYYVTNKRLDTKSIGGYILKGEYLPMYYQIMRNYK